MQRARCRVDLSDMSTVQTPAISHTDAEPVANHRNLRGYRLTRPRRVLFVLAAVWVLNMFDLGFTMVAHVHGHFTELNPIAAGMLSGPWYHVATFKFVSLGAGTIILLMLARHKVAELGSWLLLATYVFVAARWYRYFDDMLEDPLLSLLRP